MKSIIAQYRDQIREATTRAELSDIQDSLHLDYENSYIDDEDMECLLERALEASDEIFLNSNPFNQ